MGLFSKLYMGKIAKVMGAEVEVDRYNVHSRYSATDDLKSIKVNFDAMNFENYASLFVVEAF
jgi:hypothetical protein